MASEDARKLFVAGLPDSVNEEALRDLFQEMTGMDVELSLPRDRMTGRPRGFAFVRFTTPEGAEQARQLLDGHLVDGRSISVRPFQAEAPNKREGGAPGERPRRESPQNTSDRTLYVGNLPYDTTQEELEGVLQAQGVEGVTRVHLPVDQDGRRRGFGFVTLATPDNARAAVDALASASVRSRRLVVNIATPKGSSGPREGGGDRPPRSFDGPRGGGGGGGGYGGGGGGGYAGGGGGGGYRGGGGGGGGYGGGGGGGYGGGGFGGGGGGPLPPPNTGKGDGRRRKQFDGGSAEGSGGGGRRGRDDDRWNDDDE